MSGLAYSKDGKSFTLVLDQFDGSIGGVGGSSAVQAVAQALKSSPNQWLDLSNFLVDIDGVARIRGAMKAGPFGANILAPRGSGQLHMLRPGSLAAGQYIDSGPAFRARAQVSSVAGTAPSVPGTYIPATTGNVWPQTYAPSLKGNTVVLAGRSRSPGTPNLDNRYPTRVVLQGASVQTPAYVTGTATFTVGSAIVTMTNVPTSAAIGAFIVNTLDSAGFLRPYVIRNISGNDIILDEPYWGDAAGALKTFEISGIAPLSIGLTGPWGTAVNATPVAQVAAEHAGRLFLGWTQEAGSAAATGTAISDAEYKYRVRWSGLVGAREASPAVVQGNTATNAAMQGLFGWSPTGYFDLNPRFGGILAMNSFGGALVVWQQAGMTVMYGMPTFASAGSLDASTAFDGIALVGGFAYRQTEDGIFFADSNRGPMVYTGSGRPEQVPNTTQSIRKELQGATHVGYCNGHVLYYVSATRTWAFHVKTGRWCVLALPVLGYFWQHDSYECVALAADSGGNNNYVVSLDNVFNSDGTVTDSPSAATIPISMRSVYYGSGVDQLRPETVHVTLRAAGTPATTVTLYTGLPANQDAGHTDAVPPILQLQTPSSGADIANYTVDNVQVNHGNAISVQLADAGGALSAFELISIVVEGVVEGKGSSST